MVRSVWKTGVGVKLGVKTASVARGEIIRMSRCESGSVGAGVAWI